MNKIDVYIEYDIWEAKMFEEIKEEQEKSKNLEIQYELEFED